MGEPERSENWCELEEVKCSKKRATIKAKGHFNTCTDARTTSEMHLIGSTFCVLLIVFLFRTRRKQVGKKTHNFPLYLRSAGRATTTAKMTRAMSVRYMILPLDPLALLYASPHFAAIPMTYDLPPPPRKPSSNRCHSHMSIFLRFGLGYMSPQGIRPGKFISVHRRTLY